MRRPSPTSALLAAAAILIPATVDLCFAQRQAKSKPGDLPRGILVLDGSPVHDVGILRVHASNWGAIGSQPGSASPFSEAPSAEWPAGSRVEYLYVAGIWVGALFNGIPAVSTAAFATEFRPSSDPRDIVYESHIGVAGGHRVPSANADDDSDGSLDEDPLDGFDNDLDGQVDEDYAAISDQMLARRFRDDDPSVPPIFPDHNPMHLLVREESFQFDDPDYDDFVGFTFTITNDGAGTLRDLYVGVFIDGDVGHRDTPNYWEDDATGFQSSVVFHDPHPFQIYDFPYWYDVDGDGGQADAYAGIVLLDHPVDPTGMTAPSDVDVHTLAFFSGSLPYEEGGDPTNDFERYEALSNGFISQPPVQPRDYRALFSVGPFDEIAPGQTIEVSFALVVTPRNDFTHVDRAAVAYHGLWFDLDNDPATGIDGKEHQEHWYLPNDNPLPIAITRFEARALDPHRVKVEWEASASGGIESFDLLRAASGGALRRVIPGTFGPATRVFVDETVTAGEYEYLLIARDVAGAEFTSPRIGVTVPSVVLSLGQNTPNPFHESTSFAVTLPERADVDVSVYDVSGRRVATVASGVRDAGDYDLDWNGTDDAGRRVAAGVYFYRLEAGGQTLTRKLVLMR